MKTIRAINSYFDIEGGQPLDYVVFYSFPALAALFSVFCLIAKVA